MVQVLMEVGQMWEAVQSASRAAELEPEWPDAFLTLARAQLAFGEVCLLLYHLDLRKLKGGGRGGRYICV